MISDMDNILHFFFFFFWLARNNFVIDTEQNFCWSDIERLYVIQEWDVENNQVWCFWRLYKTVPGV